ncbi:MAG TPA: methyltransferase domain-containing protein [Thermoanaerobaculia bacterium]|nr:methyltransferase domain-containing protein [Thermoanaerobaculia bacterium]
MTSPALSPAVRAFDALASGFDAAFSGWTSVAAQRRAVRRALLAAFPPGARLLELGGGTGSDALFLASEGRSVHVTDGAPAMVERTREKACAAGLDGRVTAERVALEEVATWASSRAGRPPFDGAFSIFAALNCVTDHAPVARGLAGVLPPGARALLVVFGPASPVEVAVLLARGRFRAAFRRFSRRAAPARVAGETFEVTYPAPRDLAAAFAPWFALRGSTGIGVFVPPSSAEPWISRFPGVVAVAEALDRVAARPLAYVADHVLLDFVRTRAPEVP